MKDTQKERMALKMECAEEPLSAAQLSFKRNLQEQSDKVKGMIESIVNEYGGTLLCQAGMVSAYQYTLPTAPPGLKTTLPSVPVNKASSNQTIKLNMVNSNAAQGNIQLVMDPRMGVILGTVAPQITNVPMVTTANSISSPTITTNTTRVIPSQKSAVTSRPSEQTSVGGINLGKNGDTADETNKNLPDSREVTFNKINGGRTYPSLVVVARPSLRSKNITSQVVQKERSDLDMKVKGILMFPATKFTEWLIQQGLVRSEQICRKHSYGNQQKKLKLGMYSDSGTFPLSGGYVWISSCCPDQYVSVFYNSIFQNAKYTPAILLKLIYHWACQTNVQNVISWVKVTNLYVKNFFATLRSVCTAVVWDKCKKMGGKNSMIQVGVISLGTTSQDGNLRQVKVEVLGVLDPETLDLRLRACEPIKDGDRSYKKRFNNILSPLAEWVSKDSKILTDFTVDKGTLYEMGFHNVIQSAFTDQNPRNLTSNYHIMEYLRKIVPRMFQNTLSLLSRPMIQQFLDELVWREMYGPTPLRAFDNIILHTAELTKLETDDVLIDRLAKIADNPFHNWSYTETSFPSIIEVLPKSKTSAPMVTIPGDSALHSRIEVGKSFSQSRFANAKKARKRVADSTEIVSNIPEKVIKDSRPEFYPLQEFYYATMEGNKTIFNKQLTVKFSFKCFLCTTIMHTNTEIMEHMISHVPPQVPGHTDSPVCRYCCTAFSSKHQMSVHITEAHSNFGHSDSDMLVCAICEQKFGTSNLLVNHMSSTHHPSEMPYRCNTCGYRTSSHKDVIDHFYKVHDKSEGLQCPYCLKVIKFIVCGRPNSSSAHSFLIHMQRHFTRREEVNNKCPRCCLWFNQRSLLKNHLNDLHREVSNTRVVPYKNSGSAKINVSRFRQQVKRVVLDDNANYEHMFESIKRWPEGPIRVNLSDESYDCHECEEDIDIFDHYPGEQKCPNCTYVTCCWRAFNEHQKQIHNERPGMSVTVPSPLINIPLEKKMYCECDFKSNDGNLLASHLVKCDKTTAFASGGMLDCLGLQPKAMNDLF